MKLFDWAEQIAAARAAREMGRKLRQGKPTSFRPLVGRARVARSRAAVLDCGCPKDGRPEYFCIYCVHSRCEVHRDGYHPCPERESA